METKHARAALRHRLPTTLLSLMLCAYAQADAVRPDSAYNLVELQVQELPSLSIARSGHVTLYLDDGPVVFGGHTDGYVPTPTAEYLSDGQWHTVPLAYPHDQGIVLRLRSGKVLLAGGHKEDLGIGQIFSAELYDPDTHTSQGFGCMDRKRAYANAIEMADGQVLISGNWFEEDGIEMFENVNDPKRTNAVDLGPASVPRARPYIMRISDNDAIIFSSLTNKHDPIDYGIVDRLKGEPYSEPFLDTWHPIRTIDIQRSYNHFIGNEAEGRYEWLFPVEKDYSGYVSIARVTGPAEGEANPTFSLLPTQQPVPYGFEGERIIYSSLVCDRERGYAYLVGNDDEARIYVVAIQYGASGPAPVTVYYTKPQSFIVKHTTPVLTPNGDLLVTGGQRISNFFPSDAVIVLPLGQYSGGAITADRHDAEGGAGHGKRWLWALIPCLLAAGAAAFFMAMRNRQKAPAAEALVFDAAPEGLDAMPSQESQRDSYMPREGFLADLYKRIEKLMQEEQLYLNPNLRISAVAVRVGSNTTYVSTAINSQRGCSFSQYLISYRVAYAQELMRQDPDRKISTISTLSGFTTDSTFFRAFRTVTGMSPKEWLTSTQQGHAQ